MEILNLVKPVINFKILLFSLYIIIIAIILASVIKQLRIAMLSLIGSSFILTVIYLYNIMYVVSYEYKYKSVTNLKIQFNLINFIEGVIILFFILFSAEIVVKRIKGGK